jgi:hypothetical protein
MDNNVAVDRLDAGRDFDGWHGTDVVRQQNRHALKRVFSGVTLLWRHCDRVDCRDIVSISCSSPLLLIACNAEEALVSRTSRAAGTSYRRSEAAIRHFSAGRNGRLDIAPAVYVNGPVSISDTQ